MAVLEQSPWYQEILNRGVQQGIREGVQQGIIETLTARFEQAPQDVREAITRVSDANRLLELQRRAARATSIEEFRRELDD